MGKSVAPPGVETCSEPLADPGELAGQELNLGRSGMLWNRKTDS